MSYLLYSLPFSPYAQRVRALLALLEVEHELREIDSEDRPAELLAVNPAGKVPTLVDGDFALYESAVICEYLAESEGWGRAFDANERMKARQRLCMKRWDELVAPSWYRSMADPKGFEEAREEVGRELDKLAAVVEDSGADPGNLLALHVAPFWARFTWTKKLSPVAAEAEKREDLVRWLDATVLLPAIKDTLPPKAATVRRYEERFGR